MAPRKAAISPRNWKNGAGRCGSEMGEDEKRRKELVKTTGTGKPSKCSIDLDARAGHRRACGSRPSLPTIERRLAPLVEEAETIDAMLAPYEEIKEELKTVRGDITPVEGCFRREADRRAR